MIQGRMSNHSLYTSNVHVFLRINSDVCVYIAIYTKLTDEIARYKEIH